MLNSRLILERYRGMTDLFFLCMDRDGDATRRFKLDSLTQQAGSAAPLQSADLLYLS